MDTDNEEGEEGGAPAGEMFVMESMTSRSGGCPGRAAGEPSPRKQKMQCLIKTLYPCSLANWMIFLTLLLVFAFLVLPEELDEESNELVPNWTHSIVLALILYFPISFSYHYVTNCMPEGEEEEEGAE
jgi:hypothetical protein